MNAYKQNSTNLAVQSDLPEVYLHIGLPKTATTSLQDGVFNQLGDFVEYIGVRQPRTTKQPPLFRKITETVNSLEVEFDSEKVALAEELEAEIRLQKRILLISEEMFTVDHAGLTWQEKLNRLGDIFSRFRVAILVTVREPIRASYSLYVELYQLINKEYPTFASFFSDSNQAKIYRYELLDGVLRTSFPRSLIQYSSFEKIIQGYSVVDLLGGKLAIGMEGVFQLPLRNTKKLSKQGTLSKKLTLQEWMNLHGMPISNPTIMRLFLPILRLRIPYSAVLIPTNSEADVLRMKKELAHSCKYLRDVSGITYHQSH